MCADKVSTATLRHLEPIATLTESRLKELAELTFIERVSRNIDPFRVKGVAGQLVYLISGELALITGSGGSEVIVGGSPRRTPSDRPQDAVRLGQGDHRHRAAAHRRRPARHHDDVGPARHGRGHPDAHPPGDRRDAVDGQLGDPHRDVQHQQPEGRRVRAAADRRTSTNCSSASAASPPSAARRSSAKAPRATSTTSSRPGNAWSSAPWAACRCASRS